MFKFLVFLLSIVLSGLLSCSSSKISLHPHSVSYAVTQSQEERSHYESRGTKYMIATQGKAATEAAQQMFQKGGNIIDAAIAASFSISVERPQSTGLGGGGFLLYRQAKTGKLFAIDFRERAPINATEKMYLDSKGEKIKGLSEDGVLAIAVPGMVAGLTEIHKKFGSLSLATVVQPSIELAENGFEVYPYLAEALEGEKANLALFPAAAAIFLKPDGQPYKLGERFIQKDLAKTLRVISKTGKKSLYFGDISDAIVKESELRKGLITKKSLSQYRVKWRTPVSGTFNGYQIYSFPPPSSGGTHVLEVLNLVEPDHLGLMGFQSTKSIFIQAQSMQQAFADRATFMGDPDFVNGIPMNGLSSKKYASEMRKKFSMLKMRSADEVTSGNAPNYESSETTNFTIMDSAGNMVVSTQTINGWFGSKVVVPGTGIVLNNEMDDFSPKPGSSNIFGAVGGIPNSIQAGKTPLSSMAPTIVLKGNKPILALGGPGGTRIITCVAQTILNYLEFKLPLYDSIAASRIHQQWKPDQLTLEKSLTQGFDTGTVEELQKMGLNPKIDRVPCRINGVAREGDLLIGVADPRDIGSAKGE